MTLSGIVFVGKIKDVDKEGKRFLAELKYEATGKEVFEIPFTFDEIDPFFRSKIKIGEKIRVTQRHDGTEIVFTQKPRRYS